MENQTEKKQPKAYVLSELDAWIETYEKFHAEWVQWKQTQQTADDSGSNPGGPNPPPPPPGR